MENAAAEQGAAAQTEQTDYILASVRRTAGHLREQMLAERERCAEIIRESGAEHEKVNAARAEQCREGEKEAAALLQRIRHLEEQVRETERQAEIGRQQAAQRQRELEDLNRKVKKKKNSCAIQ